ncbi:MAG TPA: thioredoxin domain-containing protein, partial [Opitutaceae bacterium]
MMRSLRRLWVLGLLPLIALSGVVRLLGDTAESRSDAPVRKPNRLINEKSPYLQQHAYNPVDWYPWGEEAFARARRENKPIFLSIGYSTCHWCHVLARESFENASIARYMNEHFVCIKVDREERPDLDGVYLAFVEATTGGRGWPMTVFLTPELEPFFGGTYFPPEDKGGRPGLRSILTQMAAAWKDDPGHIVAESRRMVAELRKQAEADSPAEKLSSRVQEDGYRQLARNFDARSGGFGSAPKFARPSVLAFLFETFAEDPESDRGRKARDMALLTLRRMQEGGIHDAIGGGFHRYAVDGDWQVPHFEKMLYDQAQLAEAYLAAYQITHEALFSDTARDILAYVERDMTAPGGGFCCAEDADSAVSRDAPEHREGAFYTWTKDEVDGVIGADRAKLFDFIYGVEAGGNVKGGEFPGRNILAEKHSVAETARMSGQSAAAVQQALDESRALLFTARGARPRPHLDNKVLAAWNGLMISAYSKGYQVLGDPRYLESARRAAGFIERAMYQPESGVLQRSYCDGATSGEGFGDDYALMVQGLLDVYEASFDVHWLEWARRLQKEQNALFWDPAHGGYFGTTGGDAHVLLRSKEAHDGAEPSLNSVAALNLLRLGYLFDDAPSREWGE